jgi:hypothetical protein
VKLCPFGYDYLKGHFCVEKKEYLKSISGLKGGKELAVGEIISLVLKFKMIPH